MFSGLAVYEAGTIECVAAISECRVQFISPFGLFIIPYFSTFVGKMQAVRLFDNVHLENKVLD